MVTIDLAVTPVRVANEKIRTCGGQGDDVEVLNPDARHHIGVGLTDDITVRIRGSAGNFCAGLTVQAHFNRRSQRGLTNPFGSICGCVCDAPCEPACRCRDRDGAMQIRNLKRFVMDKVGHRYDPPAVPIGVVGAGPAGLTAAHDLCVAGYEVHVYAMTDHLGGMMSWGIPAFRLPLRTIQEDIDRLLTRCPA